MHGTQLQLTHPSNGRRYCRYGNEWHNRSAACSCMRFPPITLRSSILTNALVAIPLALGVSVLHKQIVEAPLFWRTKNNLAHILFAASWLLVGICTCLAADNDNYHLTLDTGGHMALIKSMAFSPDGAYLLSASDDKTVRIWSVNENRTIRILRGQVGPGRTGLINAVAISPNGKLVAFGGEFDGPAWGLDRRYNEL